MIHDRCQSLAVPVLFIESICDIEEIIRANILDVKMESPDYSGSQSVEEVFSDFTNRIRHYQSVYETIGGHNHYEEALGADSRSSSHGKSR